MKCAALVAAAIFLVACQTPNPDPFVPAKQHLKDGDLLQSIFHLDRVPPAHPQYAEARAIAKAVERRMRTSQRLMTKGMEMRAEWRDEEAILCFEQAREVWPHIVGADVLIAATRNRMAALEPAAPQDLGDLETGQMRLVRAPSVEGAGTGITSIRRSVDDPETPQSSGDPMAQAVEFEPEPKPEPKPEPEAVNMPSQPMVEVAKPRRTSTSPRLQEAERMLQRGQLQRALTVMEDLFAEDGQNKKIRASLVRVLHHRALLSYGQGDLDLAVADWAKVLELDPRHKAAAEFHAAASAESKIVNRRR